VHTLFGRKRWSTASARAKGPARVIVSPEDHEAFLRALEEEGVTIEREA
jgi:hypothetical protein